jgi:RNA polymerase sigma factor (sigma-70 family)
MGSHVSLLIEWEFRPIPRNRSQGYSKAETESKIPKRVRIESAICRLYADGTRMSSVIDAVMGKSKRGFRAPALDADLEERRVRRSSPIRGRASRALPVTSPRIEGISMGTEGSLTHYVRELYSPDSPRREEAARQLWLRFSGRLAAEVRQRLDARIIRRAGMDDVLQSLFAGFFAAAPGPDGPPRNRAELWRLLVHFTMCKVANTANYHRAQCRDLRREEFLGDVKAGADGSRTSDPEDFRGLDPADEASARMEFARLLDLLPDDLREVFVMRLDGYTNAQIAAQIGRVERTVELRLRTIRALLRPHMGDVGLPPGDESRRP